MDNENATPDDNEKPVVTPDEQPIVEYMDLNVKDLTVHPGYQRELDEPRRDKIVREYDERLLMPLSVSRDENGDPKYIWDGQHRHAALLKLGIEKVHCAVSDEPPREQAKLFVKAQEGRKAINWHQRHKAALFAGDEVAESIQRVLDKYGYKVVNTSTNPKAIRAIGTLYWLHGRGGEDRIRDVVEVIHHSWASIYEGAWKDRVVRGTGVFLEAYPELDRTKIVEALKASPPMGILKEASQQAKSLAGSNNHFEFAQCLVRVYNKHHGTRLRSAPLNTRTRKRRAA